MNDHFPGPITVLNPKGKKSLTGDNVSGRLQTKLCQIVMEEGKYKDVQGELQVTKKGKKTRRNRSQTVELWSKERTTLEGRKDEGRGGTDRRRVGSGETH